MNPRGSLTLFREIFETPDPVEENKRKGRSSSLNDLRNECLIHRYYWHGRLEYDGKRISYNSLLKTLADEFFLSPMTIPEIVNANLPQLAAIKRLWHDKDMSSLQRHLARKYPHLVWRLSA